MNWGYILESWSAGRWWLGPIVLIGGCWFLWKRQRWIEAKLRYLRGQMPYRHASFLLTPPERDFYKVLRAAVPPGVAIAPKIRLGDVVTCYPHEWRAGWGARIAQKHLDFVLFNELNGFILMAIELDDSSHRQLERKIRDDFVNRALEVAGVPLLRLPVRETFDVEIIRWNLKDMLPQVYRYGNHFPN